LGDFLALCESQIKTAETKNRRPINEVQVTDQKKYSARWLPRHAEIAVDISERFVFLLKVTFRSVGF